MARDSALNSWGDPIKTSESGEPVWGDAEASPDASASSGPSSGSRPGQRSSSQGGTLVHMTEKEEQIFKKAMRVVATAHVLGSLTGGYMAYRYFGRMAKPPNLFWRLGLYFTCGSAGGWVAAISMKPFVSSITGQVDDRQHFNRALRSRQEIQLQQVREKYGVAQNGNPAGRDRTLQGSAAPQLGSTEANDGRRGQAGTAQPETSTRPRSSQQGQAQPSPPTSSPPTAAEDPFQSSTGAEDTSSSSPSSSSPTHPSSRWAQIRGDPARPVSSWDRLRNKDGNQ